MMTSRAEAGDHGHRYNSRRILFDVLGVANIMALVAADVARFPDAGAGFKAYTVIVVLVVTGAWLVLRRHEHPIWLMALLQLTLLGHLAGRTVMIDGTELYRADVFGLRGDKIVHALNSLVGAAYLTLLFRRVGLELLRWEGFVVVMVTSGVGATVEIVEYLGVLLLPVTYVGNYTNNVQDLLANLIGAVAGWVLARHFSKR